MTSPTISVVIPVHNEAPILARCLRALHEQTDRPDEIIVVDNACSDDSARIAREFPLVRVVSEERAGVTYARTAGFDAAKSDVIARIDADTLVPSDWVARIRTAFREPTLDALGGGAAIAELSPGAALWFSWWYRGFRWWHERSIGITPMLYGFNSALRRDAWLTARELIELGDEHVSEDVDVTIALLRTGHTLRYDRRLIVQARLFRSVDREKLGRYYETDSLTLTRHGVGNRKRWVQREHAG